MAKIRVNKLPEGFEIKDGKVVRKMQSGGSTGDQSNYGLVTTYADKTKLPEQTQVRYSLSAVPREIANLEAEGGETVLTDLNNNGSFGLYNIKGPRHSNGGVPLFLPPQSFIFSDTKDMKFDKRTLAEFGIETRKKMTPAAVSKKFDLNKYYAAIEDEFADDIQARSADMMLDKNKMQLSKLAFAQESKKNFEEGVPLASYPYLLSQDIDPIQFTQQVENISRARAEERVIESLPPQQQMQIMMMREMVEPTTSRGRQLRRAQTGLEYIPGVPRYLNNQRSALTQNYTPQQLAEQSVQNDLLNYPNLNQDQITNLYHQYLDHYLGYLDDYQIELEPHALAMQTPISTTITQPRTQAATTQSSYTVPEGLNAEQAYMEAVRLYDIAETTKNRNDVLAFQKFFHKYYPEKAKEVLSEFGPTTLAKDAGYDTSDLRGNEDGLWGNRTKAYFATLTPPDIPEKDIKINSKKDVKVDTKAGQDKIETGDLGTTYRPPSADFWLQDLERLRAIQDYNIRMGLPWQPAVTTPQVGYTLEDPTRYIAAMNEQANIANQAIGAFAGPQSMAARTANSASRAAGAIANELAGVNQRNVQTVNQGLARQAQMDLMTGRERRDRQEQLYSDTELALENYNVEQNIKNMLSSNALVDAITNRANTQALNSIMNYFNILPSTGGMVALTNTASLQPTVPVDPNKYFEDLARNLRMLSTVPGINLTYNIDPMQFMQPQVNYQNRFQQEASQMFPYIGYGNRKKGGDLKPYATPFYMGTIGF